MSKMRQFLFGKPPFKFLAEHLVQDEDFLADARRLVGLSQETVDLLAARFRNSDEFLDRGRLIALTEETLGQGEGPRELASSIHKVAGMLHDADKPAAEAMEDLGEAINEHGEALQPEERSVLIERLRVLAAEPIGLAKQCKARELVDAIGAELDEFQIICDIRPIFDGSRERIEGVVPLAVLRLEYTLPDGEAAVVEMRVTEKQLSELESKLTTAKCKLKSIKELAARSLLPIPKTKATVTGEN